MRNIKFILDFCGSSSVGKTSVINRVKNSFELRYRNIWVQESASRKAAENNIITSELTTSSTQYMISFQNLSTILRNILDYDIICSTDFLIRSLAYSLQINSVPEDLIIAHENLLTFFLSEFAFRKVVPIFFFIPIEFPAVPDGVRSTSEKYHKAIESRILGVYEEFKINYTVLTGSINSRMDTVLKRISSEL